MDGLSFFLFRFAPAMKMIFELSYIPKEEDFKELTPAQYQAMYRKVPEEDLKPLERQRVLAFLPDDAKVYSRAYRLYGNDLVIVGSEEVSAFATVESLIEKCCSGQDFQTLTEKLVYMAQTLPEELSEGTAYAIHGKARSLRRK